MPQQMEPILQQQFDDVEASLLKQGQALEGMRKACLQSQMDPGAAFDKAADKFVEAQDDVDDAVNILVAHVHGDPDPADDEDGDDDE